MEGLLIHQTRRFEKQLQAMDKAGKNERDAARRARAILARLQHDPLDTSAENKRTRYGELRLDNCRKYDLACGFRLIGLKRAGRLIFTYIGSHDDCQRWIENNREHQEKIESIPVPLMRNIKEESRQISPTKVEPTIDEYGEQLMILIDDQLMRGVFSGFYKKAGV